MRHQQKREEAKKKRQEEKVRIDNVPVPYYRYFKEEQKKIEEENKKTEDKEAKWLLVAMLHMYNFIFHFHLLYSNLFYLNVNWIQYLYVNIFK